jgi:hypothetical protein
MFQGMDRHICYESNSSHEGNHRSTRIPVDTRCTDHRCNPADKRTTLPDRCVGILRSYRMDGHRTDAVVRLLLVRLESGNKRDFREVTFKEVKTSRKVRLNIVKIWTFSNEWAMDIGFGIDLESSLC